MIPGVSLHIRLTRRLVTPAIGQSWVNEVHGGPDKLLAWLEIQLGLRRESVPEANRITEYAAALDTVSDAVFSKSLQTDRWATTRELLARRDELRLAGWSEQDDETLPRSARDLARAAKGRSFAYADEAGRLHDVLHALAAGQKLPPHKCILIDPPELWPQLWQDVFAKLDVASPPAAPPCASEGTSLRSAQTIVRAGQSDRFVPDASFRYITTRSETAACEFIAAALSEEPGSLSETIVYIEDDALALRLDACLNRIGLPTMGSAAQSTAHPILQVLPLFLALAWDPVDPQALLDFLTLPVNPLPRHVARRFGECLSEQPGLGSASWEQTLLDLCSKANDSDGALRTRISAWLLDERAARGTPISASLVRKRCSLVAQWAAGRALLMSQESVERNPLVDALLIAAGHASTLGELVESQGSVITEPQLSRLLEETLSSGAVVMPFMETFQGPRRVRSLAEIRAPFKRLIWLGLGTEDTTGCRWPTADREQLKSAGIDLDDGSRAVTALRSEEARGFEFVEESFMAVLLPQDLTQRWHPIWLAIRNLLETRDNPVILETVISDGNSEAIAPFTLKTAQYQIQPPPKERPLWTVPKALLRDRTTVSASELQDRLACPLKWVLNYQAKIRPSSIMELPDSFRLKGTFCHSVLERVFGRGGPLPSVDDAADQIGLIFDERLALDAAPLAQPGRASERRKLRAELISAARVLVAALESGGYRISGIEVELAADAFGKSLTGWIDCVAVHDSGQEAIIDFKYSGRNKYYDLLKDGRALQLATYAHGRSQDGADGRIYPAVAYLVLADAQLYTPSGSPLAGGDHRFVIDGRHIRDVWESFNQAIAGADDWLSGDQPIPARPLQASHEWPNGAEMALVVKLRDNESQDVCRYCDYKRLCGIEGLT